MRESVIYILSVLLLFLLPDDPCYKKLETIYFSPICSGASALIEGNVDESTGLNVSYSWVCTDGQTSTDEDFVFTDMTGINETCVLTVSHGNPNDPCIVVQDIIIEVRPEVAINVMGHDGPYCQSESFQLTVDCLGFISSSHGTPDTQAGTIDFVPGDLPTGITTVEIICTGAGNCESEPYTIDIEICEQEDFQPTCRDFRGGLP